MSELMARQIVKESRPSRKYSSGNPIEYRNTIARYELAVNNPGMSARGKLLELSHWFSGHAGEVVECYAAHRDPDVAYATARSQLDSLFGASCDSVVPLVQKIASGRLIRRYNLDGHLTLFTRMLKAEEMATEIGQIDKDAALRDEENTCINLSLFKKLLHRWINILTTRKTLLPFTEDVAANLT